MICNKEANKTISSDILDILARHIQQYGQVQTIDIDNYTDKGKCEGKNYELTQKYELFKILCHLGS